jgi:hypothetical protein
LVPSRVGADVRVPGTWRRWRVEKFKRLFWRFALPVASLVALLSVLGAGRKWKP